MDQATWLLNAEVEKNYSYFIVVMLAEQVCVWSKLRADPATWLLNAEVEWTIVIAVVMRAEQVCVRSKHACGPSNLAD